jgi:transcriptional regulator with XRE-family HTH domain
MTDEEDRTYGATVVKRRLSRRLAAMRGRAGLTANEVSDKLNWNRGRLQRIEANQWRLPEPSYVRDLARIYGAADAEEAELLDLVVHARERLWWRSYEDVFGKDNEFPGYENDAARISVYMPLVLPGLLQTAPYIGALLRVGPWPERWRDRALEARLRRQQILDRPDTAPQLTAVITEASLAYHWGSSDERRAQVEHLITMGHRPNVNLRLLRFENGAHPGMSSLVDIFEFPGEEDTSVVYLENDTALEEVTNAVEVKAHRETFARICQAAASPAATRASLVKLAGSLELLNDSGKPAHRTHLPRGANFAESACSWRDPCIKICVAHFPSHEYDM